ncbi:syntaxin-17 isoform X2 [Belonocnema kinseyi]|nr:syntaxin-17 isoform X2 [Belonocnema kinseyi]
MNQNWGKVYKEQINAMRVVKQLKQLVYEMDMLRSQVLDRDIFTFDKLTKKARNDAIAAIGEYLELELKLPFQNSTLTEDESQIADDSHSDKYIQLQDEHEELERQKACLYAWNSLQNDLQQLHQLFIDFNKIVHDQSESVDAIVDNVEVTKHEVAKGTEILKKASKYKAMTYPLAGALIGTCFAGPIGFFAGLKIGGLSAIGGGILGYTGGAFLKKSHISSTESPGIKSVTMLGEGQHSLDSALQQEESKNSKKHL